MSSTTKILSLALSSRYSLQQAIKFSRWKPPSLRKMFRICQDLATGVLLQCVRPLHYTILCLTQGLFVKEHPEKFSCMYKLFQNLWQGME